MSEEGKVNKGESMILDVGDTVIVQMTSADGVVTQEVIAKIVKVTNRLDFYLVRYMEDLDGLDKSLHLHEVPLQNKVEGV